MIDTPSSSAHSVKLIHQRVHAAGSGFQVVDARVHIGDEETGRVNNEGTLYDDGWSDAIHQVQYN